MGIPGIADPIPGQIPVENIFWRTMRAYCFEEAKRILSNHSYDDDVLSVTKTAHAVGAALQKASLRLKEWEQGNFDVGDEPTAPQPATRFAQSLGTLTALLDGWWLESKAAGLKPSTYESYRNTFSGFVRYLGHDSLARVSEQDVVGFKNHRLTTPSPKTGRIPSAKTVKHGDLAALKSVFKWGVHNGHCTTNPS